MFEWAASLFVLGTVGFWILTVIAFVAMIACIEYEDGFKATTIFAIAALVISASNHFNPFTWIVLNWQTALLIIGAYLLLGAVWGIVKWYFHLKNRYDRHVDLRDSAFKKYHVNSMDALKIAMVSNSYEFSTIDDSRKPPLANENKANILMWMSYWPVSALWTLTNDPIKRAFRAIYREISSILDKMSESIFKDISKA